MKEKRKITFKNIEIRSELKEDKKCLIGIIPYDSRSVPIWGVTEIIDKSAFNKTLNDKNEVRALWNHNDNFILGNTKSETLSLENTDSGLICRCELPNTTYANDLYEIIDRGDVRTMSFGFTPNKWEDSNNGKLRTLKEVQLHEVSFGVTFPAYQETTSLSFMRGLEKRNINLEQLNATLEKDNLEDDDKIIIKNTIDNLSKLIEVKEEPKKETVEPKQEVIEQKEDTTALQLQIETEILV
jgi:HK97 family phage prohead protease